MLTKKDINCKCILAVPREKGRGFNNNTVCALISFSLEKSLSTFWLLKNGMPQKTLGRHYREVR